MALTVEIIYTYDPTVTRGHEAGKPDRNVGGFRPDAASPWPRLPRQRHQLRHRQDRQLRELPINSKKQRFCNLWCDQFVVYTAKLFVAFKMAYSCCLA